MAIAGRAKISKKLTTKVIEVVTGSLIIVIPGARVDDSGDEIKGSEERCNSRYEKIQKSGPISAITSANRVSVRGITNQPIAGAPPVKENRLKFRIIPPPMKHHRLRVFILGNAHFIPSTDLKGHKVIKKGSTQRHNHKKNHGSTMHSKHLVVFSVCENLHVMAPKLRTNK